MVFLCFTWLVSGTDQTGSPSARSKQLYEDSSFSEVASVSISFSRRITASFFCFVLFFGLFIVWKRQDFRFFFFCFKYWSLIKRHSVLKRLSILKPHTLILIWEFTGLTWGGRRFDIGWIFPLFCVRRFRSCLDLLESRRPGETCSHLQVLSAALKFLLQLRLPPSYVWHFKASAGWICISVVVLHDDIRAHWINIQITMRLPDIVTIYHCIFLTLQLLFWNQWQKLPLWPHSSENSSNCLSNLCLSLKEWLV